MRRFALALSVCLMVLSSGCLKDSTNGTNCQDKTVQSEAATIQAYATNQGITATADPSGLYYQITNPGTGISPTVNSKVFVTYTGKLLDGSTFDSGTTPVSGWLLSDLIRGWQIGLPLLKKGGSIKLIIPSALAYGCRGKASIPGNTILYFDITLNDVQ